MALAHACRITGVNREEHLRASHCKPWRDAINEERLDGENGLLLTPSMGLDPKQPPNVGAFSSGQRKYLEFHRENVLLMSRFLEHL